MTIIDTTGPFIPHEGGERPCEGMVWVRMRGEPQAALAMAEHMSWRHSGEDWDIVEYMPCSFDHTSRT